MSPVRLLLNTRFFVLMNYGIEFLSKFERVSKEKAKESGQFLRLVEREGLGGPSAAKRITIYELRRKRLPIGGIGVAGSQKLKPGNSIQHRGL